MSERIMAIDPSTTCTGWAMAGLERQDDWPQLAGRIPKPSKLKGIAAARYMVDQVYQLITDHVPARIVIEVPDRSVGHAHKGGGSGLARYGVHRRRGVVLLPHAPCWRAGGAHHGWRVDKGAREKGQARHARADSLARIRKIPSNGQGP